MIFDHNETIKKACELIAIHDFAGASRVVADEYPFSPPQKSGRHSTPRDMTRVFRRDGFIDRYKGTCLVFPPVLHLLSHYLPLEFPYQANWSMAECHMAYWQLMPTIDHVVPVARGGADAEGNWVCCSMLTNSIKSNWTLEELQWTLQPPGDPAAWDGLMDWFLQQVLRDPATLENPYIKHWHGAAIETMQSNSTEGVVAACAGVNKWLEGQDMQACSSAKPPSAIDHNKESVADFKKRFDAIMATLPDEMTDDQLKAHGAVDVTDDHRGLGIIIGHGCNEAKEM